MPFRYPQEAVVRDGRRVMIRPFTKSDTDALYEFFQGLPPEIRRFAWDRVDSKELVEGWGRNLDYSKALPLLALEGSRIVADATIHFRQGGLLRLVGRVRWLIHPDFRGVGLGTLLVNRFIDIAGKNGLRHLSCLLISDLEADAIRVLSDLGFEKFTLPDYGTDPDGDQHDMTLMVLKL